MKTLYDDLGVPRDATVEEIKKAYYTMAKNNHPDKNKAGTSDKMAIINHAYDILSDKEKRERYDKTGQDKDVPFIAKFMGFIDAVFIKLVEAAPNVHHIDLIDQFKNAVKEVEFRLMEKKNQIDIMLQKFETVERRLKSKRDNAIKISVANRVNILRAESGLIKAEIEFVLKCKEVLEEYNYDWDQQVVQEEYMAFRSGWNTI